MNSEDRDNSTPDRQAHGGPFSDPALQAAVVRAWGNEKAPSALRGRVERMLEAPAVVKKREPVPLRQRLMWPLAAGIAIVLFLQIRSLLPPAAPPPLAALPASLYDDLIKRHEVCVQLPNHHALKATPTDDAAMTKELQTQLSLAVLIAHPTGWNFRGAAICPVGTTNSAHLVFTKNTDSLSLFSLPEAAACDLTDGLHFQTTINGHPVVSFSKNGGLFCLVASSPQGSITLANLVEMRTTMESAVSMPPSCATACAHAPGELMYVVPRR